MQKYLHSTLKRTHAVQGYKNQNNKNTKIQMHTVWKCSEWAMVLNLESSVFCLLNSWGYLYGQMAVVSNVLQAVCNEGAVGAVPSLWVVLAVSGWQTRCLFVSLHVSDGRLDFRIRVMASHQALLWRDLLRFHNSWTKVAGSPIELLW